MPKSASLPSDFGRQTFEMNCHVRLTNDFYLAVFRLTRRQWQAVRPAYSDANVSTLSRSLYPSASAFRWAGGMNASVKNLRGEATDATAVSATPSAGSYLGPFRARTRVAFDIPTSLEWEFACRAGTSGPLYNSSGWNAEALDVIAWTKTNAGDVRYPVAGLKQPNAWGLHDMIGGQHDLCRDFFVDGQQLFTLLKGKGFSADDPADNPVCLVAADAGVTELNRIRAGGASTESVGSCRATMRMKVGVGDTWAAARLSCPAAAWWLGE